MEEVVCAHVHVSGGSRRACVCKASVPSAVLLSIASQQEKVVLIVAILIMMILIVAILIVMILIVAILIVMILIVALVGPLETGPMWGGGGLGGFSNHS